LSGQVTKDIIIQRALHLCGVFNIDVEQEILKKLKLIKIEIGTKI